MHHAHLPTSIICRGCNAGNLIGAVLCEGCGTLLSSDVIDPSPQKPEPQKAAIGECPRFIVIQLNGADIPLQAELSVPIPLDKLRAHEPIFIGRRLTREPDYPPEMDFGFLFYYAGRDERLPISRKSAVVIGRRGKISLRRVGSGSISLKKDGQGMNCPIEQGQAVNIHNGDVLIFGRTEKHFRVQVVIPDDILKEI